MGMGLTNAPATFQKLMNRVLGVLLWKTSMAYLDDIVIFSESYDQHLIDLEEVFARIRKAKLKIKPPKCSFAKSGIQYLGYMIGPKGVECDPETTRKVATFHIPRSKTEVRQFLGLSGYYRKFVKNYADIARPLHDLTRLEAPFDWTAECQVAFERLKSALTSPPILAYPDFEKKFILSTDASGVGLGAVLKQKQDGRNERVIAYASRVLDATERTYEVIEKEYLAFKWACEVFRPYLHGVRFTWQTDNKPLVDMKKAHPNSRIQKFNAALIGFEYDVDFKPGRLNSDADALSRYGMEPNRSDRTQSDSGGAECSKQGEGRESQQHTDPKISTSDTKSAVDPNEKDDPSSPKRRKVDDPDEKTTEIRTSRFPRVQICSEHPVPEKVGAEAPANLTVKRHVPLHVCCEHRAPEPIESPKREETPLDRHMKNFAPIKVCKDHPAPEPIEPNERQETPLEQHMKNFVPIRVCREHPGSEKAGPSDRASASPITRTHVPIRACTEHPAPDPTSKDEKTPQSRTMENFVPIRVCTEHPAPASDTQTGRSDNSTPLRHVTIQIREEPAASGSDQIVPNPDPNIIRLKPKRKKQVRFQDSVIANEELEKHLNEPISVFDKKPKIRDLDTTVAVAHLRARGSSPDPFDSDDDVDTNVSERIDRVTRYLAEEMDGKTEHQQNDETAAVTLVDQPEPGMERDRSGTSGRDPSDTTRSETSRCGADEKDDEPDPDKVWPCARKNRADEPGPSSRQDDSTSRRPVGPDFSLPGMRPECNPTPRSPNATEIFRPF